MTEYDKEIETFIEKQDETEFNLGDTLDVKTSIALIVVTFLATQSAEFLKGNPPLTPCWHDVQLASVLCLVLAGLLAILELVPRKYNLPMAPDDFLGWVDKLEKYYEQSPDPKQSTADAKESVLAEIHRRETEKIKIRFAKNRRANERKSCLIEWLFRLTMAALVLNLVTLVRLWWQG
jgi:hypothetical protein